MLLWKGNEWLVCSKLMTDLLFSLSFSTKYVQLVFLIYIVPVLYLLKPKHGLSDICFMLMELKLINALGEFGCLNVIVFISFSIGWSDSLVLLQIISAICFLRGKAYEALENRSQARQWLVSPAFWLSFYSAL